MSNADLWPEIYHNAIQSTWVDLYGMFVAMCYLHGATLDITSQDAQHGVLIPGMSGQLLLIEQDPKTVVVVFAPPEDPFWSQIGPALEKATEAAQVQRRVAWGYTVEEVILYYYRQRAAGGKLSLKKIAQQAGFSYSYITKAKTKYDRASKLGSEVEENVIPENDVSPSEE